MDLAVGGGEHGGERGQRVILRLRANAPVRNGAQHIEDQGRPGPRQPLQKVPTGVPATDGLGESAVDRTGVEPLLESEHTGPGDVISGNDRSLDRSGSAPSGKQREVEVQPAVLRDVQQIGRNQAAVGDHDRDVDPEVAQPVAHVVGLLTLEGGRSTYVESRVTGHGRHR